MKTKRVRIALAINASGEWAAAGGSDMPPTEAIDLADGDLCGPLKRVYWLHAEVPIPEPESIDVGVTLEEVRT